MEEELRCFCCKEFYREPVLLPCNHALCRACGVKLQAPLPEADNNSVVCSDYLEADKASVTSETDSGVVCGSRPNSFAGTAGGAPLYLSSAFSLICPVCNKQVLLDEHGADSLPPFRVMRTIVEKFGGISAIPAAEEACQMCEGIRRAAVVRCEQCAVRYCAVCRDSWHPIRGPLAQHELRALGTTCTDHAAPPTVYCNTCMCPVCQRCVSERHATHETQALSSAAKAHKTELSQALHHLSEQAKSMTDYITSVTGSGDTINESCEELESQIETSCLEIIKAVERRKDELIRIAHGTKQNSIDSMRTLKSVATQKLREATALLHFSIEALKEADHAAFLQVGSMLSVRAHSTAASLHESLTPAPVTPALTLDIQPVIRSINNLNFIECIPPGAPEMAVEQCCARGSSCTLAWRPPPPPAALTGYVLELDDGLNGPFREVYCGRETVCTIDGLHYASLYSARVKAFNGAGDGPYSEIIGLQTSPVAWFTWDSRCVDVGGGVAVSSDGRTASVSGWQHRVVRGDTPLSRGIHHWTLTIDQYEGDADPAFGVARVDVATDKMLGSDAMGWAMYIDGVRSWVVHGGAHADRCTGGVHRGATVGVTLDLNGGTLAYTVDGRPQGGVAFTGLKGTFYPAMSLNRGVTVTLESGLTPPEDLSQLTLN